MEWSNNSPGGGSRSSVHGLQLSLLPGSPFGVSAASLTSRAHVRRAANGRAGGARRHAAASARLAEGRGQLHEGAPAAAVDRPDRRPRDRRAVLGLGPLADEPARTCLVALRDLAAGEARP